MSVKARLSRLENKRTQTAPRRACPECGANGDPDQPKAFSTSFEVLTEPESSDHCSTCGRHWRFRVKFDKAG